MQGNLRETITFLPKLLQDKYCYSCFPSRCDRIQDQSHTQHRKDFELKGIIMSWKDRVAGGEAMVKRRRAASDTASSCRKQREMREDACCFLYF